MGTSDLLHRAALGPLTIDDVLGDDDERHFELIDGSLYVIPLADLEHQSLVMRYAMLMAPNVPEGLRTLPGVNVIVGRRTIVQPDVVVVDPGFVTAGGLGVTPEGLRLAVEITSASTRRRDLTIKRDLYAEWGVPYIVVDRATGPLTVHVFGDLPSYGHVLVDAVRTDRTSS